MKSLVGILILLLLPAAPARADWAALLNVGYASDSFVATTTSATGLMYTGAVLMLGLDKKDRFYLGYHFGSSTQTATLAGTTGTFATTDLGPFMAYYLNKSRTIGFTLGYNLQATAKYKDGTAAQAEWSGTSYHAGFGLEQEISEGIWFGAKVTLYSMAYSRDVTLGATNSTISYTRQWVMPTLSLSFR